MQEYFSGGRLFRLCLKELRESLRDRRTLFTLVLMPILVYPLLSMAMQRLVIGAGPRGAGGPVEYVVGAGDEEEARVVASVLRDTMRAANDGVRPAIEIRRQGGTKEEKSTGAEGGSVFTADALRTAADAAFSIVIPERGSIQDALRVGNVDLAVTRASREQVLPDGSLGLGYVLEMEFREGDARSEGAMLEFRKAMELVNDMQSLRLRGRFLPRVRGEIIGPAVRLVSSGTGKRGDVFGALSGILPLILILMTITGAVYPAIDLTAGERERGTMEAMIATPAPRFVLLLSKYVAVVTVAILTAVANLFASWLTLSLGGLGRALLGEKGLSISVLVQIFPLLVIFAAFFSAILLAMCSYARSFKEAQAYLIPVMLVSLAPGLLVLMPGIEFTTLLGIVPLVNILLLSRDIMTGSPAVLPAFAAVFSTLLYAVAALVVAARLFGGESATAGSQETWSDLFRRPRVERSVPDLGELAVYFALLFPVFFIITNLLGGWVEGIRERLWVNAAVLFALFFLVPTLVAWYRRLRMRETFLLRAWWSGVNDGVGGEGVVIGARGVFGFLGVLLGVLFLGVGLWVIAYEVVKLFAEIGIGPIDLERTEELERAKNEFARIPLWLVWLTSALVPAFAEEYFFRGYVLSSFRGRVSRSRAVVFSGLIFGLFHVVSGSHLTLERFMPTVLLGLFLGWVAIRTGSLWPGVFLHAIHNGLLFWLTRFSQRELAQWFGEDNEHFPALWIVASLVSLGLGVLLIFYSTAKRFDENTP
jgi:ABC-2 type transport system permease protein/sodium transport system permease protein